MIPPSLGVRTFPCIHRRGCTPGGRGKDPPIAGGADTPVHPPRRPHPIPGGAGTPPPSLGMRTPPSMPCWSCEPPGGAKRTSLLPGLRTPPSIPRRVCSPREERERPPISGGGHPTIRAPPPAERRMPDGEVAAFDLLCPAPPFPALPVS